MLSIEKQFGRKFLPIKIRIITKIKYSAEYVVKSIVVSSHFCEKQYEILYLSMFDGCAA